MIILGVNAYHGDSSACLLINGKVVNAVDEERFTRIKHWAGFPRHAIEFCLKNNGLTASDIDYVAINSDPTVNRIKKIRYAVSQFSPTFILSHLKNRQQKESFVTDFAKYFMPLNKEQFIQVEHHRSHLASAYYPSGFSDSALLSVDGFGDYSSAAWGLARDNEISIEQYIHFPHSLGIYYQALTQFLGFHHYGDEYKIMGMSAYGKPKYQQQIAQLITLNNNGFSLNLSYFNHHQGEANYRCVDGKPLCDVLYKSDLSKLLAGVEPRLPNNPVEQVHHDIAASAQAVYEKAFFHLLDIVYQKTNCEYLSLAGGCALNSLANGKIHDNSAFKHVFIPAAAGDSGGAIGAAYEAHRQVDASTKFTQHKIFGAYLGPAYSKEDYQNTIKSVDLSTMLVEQVSDDQLYDQVASQIANGKVIGWFDGAMEWGARALGHRSILADPRRQDMQSILNEKIKLREGFRPFAPSILKEHVSDWFEKDIDVPYMTQVIKIKQEKQQLIPAVTHVDGTGRLQTLMREENERYYALIDRFFAKTGVPMVINTSFNENEPVVCQPSEAMACFLRTKMDVLVLGNFIISR